MKKNVAEPDMMHTQMVKSLELSKYALQILCNDCKKVSERKKLERAIKKVADAIDIVNN